MSLPEKDNGRHENKGGPSAVAHPILSVNEDTFASPGCGLDKDVLAYPSRGEGHPLGIMSEAISPEWVGEALQEDHAIDRKLEQLQKLLTEVSLSLSSLHPAFHLYTFYFFFFNMLSFLFDPGTLAKS